MSKIPQKDIDSFKSIIWNYYHKHKREMDWRKYITPYGIVVSEIMLQQTQVPRVMQKYPEFLQRFPTFESLAMSSLADVIAAWQGMGYNRRAKYLREIAILVVEKYNGNLPDDPTILQSFPGLGHATANSIVAFAFKKPVVFIETNIRRVFIHHFFHDAQGIHDKEIMPFVEATVDISNPREWYYALMDYGTALVKQVPNPNRKSKHYTKQASFEGSLRQVRGGILRFATEHTTFTADQLISQGIYERVKINTALEALLKEGFLVKDESKDTYTITT